MGAFLLPFMPYGHTHIADSANGAGVEAAPGAVILEPGLEAAALEVHECQLIPVVGGSVQAIGKPVKFGAAVVKVRHVVNAAGLRPEPVQIGEVGSDTLDDLGGAHASNPDMLANIMLTTEIWRFEASV